MMAPSGSRPSSSGWAGRSARLRRARRPASPPGCDGAVSAHIDDPTGTRPPITSYGTSYGVPALPVAASSLSDRAPELVPPPAVHPRVAGRVDRDGLGRLDGIAIRCRSISGRGIDLDGERLAAARTSMYHRAPGTTANELADGQPEVDLRRRLIDPGRPARPASSVHRRPSWSTRPTGRIDGHLVRDLACRLVELDDAVVEVVGDPDRVIGRDHAGQVSAAVRDLVPGGRAGRRVDGEDPVLDRRPELAVGRAEEWDSEDAGRGRSPGA